LLVREAEQREPVGVGGIRPNLLLETREQCRVDGCAFSYRKGQPSRRPGSPAATVEDAAQEQGGSGRDRRRPTNEKPPRRHYGFCWPFVLSNPLNGSA
jgi:hypothetical protein